MNWALSLMAITPCEVYDILAGVVDVKGIVMATKVVRRPMKIAEAIDIASSRLPIMLLSPFDVLRIWYISSSNPLNSAGG